MTSDHASRPLEALLAHREWVRSLARRLTENAVDADDLEQDAWLAAARARPADGVGIRAWFAKVMRNRAAERRRLDVHRGTRETVVAREIGLRTGAALAVNAESHTRVVQAVLALVEPYRETVLLRFYEGLPPREVAAQMRVPVDTVKTRLRRAAETLRETLGGRREDWLGAIAPLLVARHAPPGTAAAVAGGVAMKATTKAAIAAAALLALAAVVVWSAPRGDVPGMTPEHSERDVAAAGSPDRDRVPVPRRRDSPAADAATADAAAADTDDSGKSPQTRAASPSPGVGRIVGRILLPDGTPAAGAAVGGPGTRGWSATDADGRYTVGVTPREDGAEQPLWVVLPGYRAAGIGLFRVVPGTDQATEDVRLVADGTVVVRGRVVSRAGREISSGEVVASVVTEAPLIETARRSRDPGPMLMLSAAWPGKDPPVAALRDFEASKHAAVGAGGSFELRLPASLGIVTLVPDVPGHATSLPAARSVQEWAEREVEIVVDPALSIRGTVVNAVTGTPIEGAVVGEGPVAVRSDASGAFEWSPPSGGWNRVRIAADGYFEEYASPRQDGSPVTVTLSRRRTLAGVVRLTDGSAVPGAFVALVAKGAAHPHANATTDAAGRFSFQAARDGSVAVIVQPTPAAPSFLLKTFEDVAAGGAELELVVEPGLTICGRIVNGEGRPVPRMKVMPFAVANAAANRSGHIFTAVSGDDGTFVVNGLPPGRHGLDVYDSFDEAGGWLGERLADVEAGKRDLVVVVRMGLTISGRVVDGEGRPVFGKRVIADDVARNPLLGGWFTGPALDAGGRFVVRGLRPGRYRLELGDVTNDPTRYLLAGGESVEAGAKDLTLTRIPGGSLSGVVEDASGTPVAGEWVSVLWDPADASGRSVASDDQGRFEFRGLPPDHAYAVKARGVLVRDVALGTRDVRVVVRPEER